MDMDMLVKSFLTPQRKEELKAFIGLVEKNPQVLYHPDLAFFKNFLEHFGAKIPEQEKPKPKPAPEEKKPEPEPPKEAAPEGDEMKDDDEEEPEEPEEPEQPDDELMTPDTNSDELPLGDESKEVSDDDRAAAGEAKMKAAAAQNEGKLEEALKLFTESIVKNPTSALTYGSRAALLLKMKRPNAAIRDCNRALQLNPESAKALKVRGKAYRYIGEYEKAKKDLQTGNRIDFDDDTFAVQKFVEDRLRGKERRELARAAREREREATRKQREFEERKRKWEEQRRREQEEEEREKQQQQQQAGGMPGGLNELFSDPEIVAALQDPDTQKKVFEALQDPTKIMEYQKDPKIGPALTKIMEKISQSSAAAGGCGCGGGACGRGAGGCGCGGGACGRGAGGCGCGGGACGRGAGGCGCGGCGGAGMGGMGGFQFPH